jgi:hypothetical protein
MSEKPQEDSPIRRSSEKTVTPEKVNNDKLLKEMIDIALAEISSIEKKKKNVELEVRFGTKGIKHITKIDFDNVIKKLKSLGFKPENEEYLLRAYPEYIDATTGITKTSSVRLELTGFHNIQTYCKTNSLEKVGGFKFVQKGIYKNKEGKPLLPVDYDDFNFRVALNSEDTIKEDSPIEHEIKSKWADSKKTFRYINRVKLYKSELPFTIDFSIVKRSHRGILQDKYLKKSFQRHRQVELPEYTIADSKVFEDEPRYEIEIEMENRNIPPNYGSEKVIVGLKQIIKYILSGLQQTNYPVSYREQKELLKNYLILTKGKDYNPEMRILSRDFIGPSSNTLQLINILPVNQDSLSPNIRNNYTVTDKADGDRKLMFIDTNGKVYLIDMNMNVQFTGCITDGLYGNSILDGEHILHDKYGKFINLYAAFDIYFLNGKDKRALEFVTMDPQALNANFRLPLLNVCIKNINLKSVVPNERQAPLRIECKTFYTSSERQSIFEGCKTIMMKARDLLFEYDTDGLIFTPTNMGVGLEYHGDTIKNTKVTWSYSFKWKPPEFNTIDFLVSIKKGPNGEDVISNMFKDGINVSGLEQIDQYKTLILRVGFDTRKHGYLNPCEDIYQDKIQGPGDIDNEEGYKPVRFYPTNPYDPEASICNIMLKDDNSGNKKMMTEEGEIIEDNTIVEFKYVSINEKLWRWVPIRVRYEKTAELRMGIKNYGNAYHVANDNWHSIHYPVKDIMLNTGEGIPNELGDDDVYYNKTTNVSKTRGLRDFHNLFVKKLLIMSVSKSGDTLIDYAVGKGGDIPKWITSNLSFVFGIDISRDNIENKLDGVCARYLNYRKKFKIMPSGLFVNGNSSVNIRNTNAIYTQKGKQITKAIFGEGAKDEKQLGKGVYKQFGKAKEGFDISSIQFALHYMFENNLILQNFLRNVSECTKVGGYFIATSYDGETLFRALSDKSPGESISVYQDETKIWEVKKIYDNITFDDDISSLGYAVDVYQETINKVFREYLVNFNYLTRLMENYGFVQITNSEAKQLGLPGSSGMFNELYNVMEQEISRNTLKERDYGDSMYMTNGEKRISFLNRYFVYKKIRNVDAEIILNTLLDTTKQAEKVNEDESKHIENEIEKKTSKRFVKKLNQKLRLVMIEPNVIPLEEKVEAEVSAVFKDIDKNIGEQPPQASEQQKRAEEASEDPQPTAVIIPGTEVQIQEEIPFVPIIPLIKKKGRPKKLIVIQEEIPLQIENIQEVIVQPLVKKRGRTRKTDK